MFLPIWCEAYLGRRYFVPRDCSWKTRYDASFSKNYKPSVLLKRIGLWSKSKKSATTRQEIRVIQQIQTVNLRLGSRCPYFINTSYATFQGIDCVGSAYDLTEATSIPTSLSIGRLNSDERSMFAYFIDEVCPSCTLSPAHNPYINYIAPLAFESAATRHAILGVAATELYWRCGDVRYRHVCVNHKIKALRALQRDIAAIASSGCIQELTFQIAASTLMLCFLEVSSASFHMARLVRY